MKRVQIDNLHFELMIDENQIQKRIRLIGVDINHRYEKKNPVFIGVLNGCFMFMSDLLKQVVIPCEMSFIKLASYQGTNQGEVNELIGLGIDLEGRDVIIVEDIVDSGKSLNYTIEVIEKQLPASVVVCTLLLKPECLQYDFENIQYVGFEIEKEFVVGYGMDYNGLGRNISDIYKNVPF
ncbi:hypoxanthine phosphoribosyltransferase [Sphingobacterium sp. SG20118]|uniref:hypoxanthine phosphoribosyltransferase n=1 Tax=Sphingobacterium TaxID=28453 RepID=UPI0004F62C3F|nr:MULTISPECIES: hypoxanthine phosphoribosyltransferase [Sphingobacterium]AIM38867.1 hypoxanthine phosphoribosyltransferase [Sphingobacterium sp. ML3W]MDH5825149.1 hypoxanthine phosphoribosyltransferase [Sphingobacterium faecium]